MRNYAVFVLLLITVLVHSGCSFLLNKTLGLKPIKKLTESRIAQTAASFKIPPENSFVLDSTWRTTFSDGLSHNNQPIKNELHKNHLQPLQASYYNNAGKLVSFQINCYAGGFPNLNWTRDSIFEHFPPGPQAPLDSLLTLHEHLRYLKPLPGAIAPEAGTHYTVIIHWTRFMHRQTKLFLETVHEHIRKKAPAGTRVLFVNCDNLYVQ